jgi:hypothetical protein
MYRIEFFMKLNGEEPALIWINSRDGSIRPNIYQRIETLKKEGLNLLNTNSLDTIKGDDPDFYELRNLTKKWRLGLYFDEGENTFVLLHGWKHDEQHPREQQKEIEKARQYLHEYLASREQI